MAHLLKYGIYKQDGEEEVLRYIEDVPTGKLCRCKCPDCGGDLEAKNKGTVYTHHFRHTSGIECIGSRMSALHLLAQKMIAERREIIVPQYVRSIWGKAYKFSETTRVRFTEVKLESRFCDSEQTRIPDCIGITESGKELWIEIYVAHGLSPAKRAFIESNKIACVEIDLSGLYEIDYREDHIKNVLETDKYCNWVNNPQQQARYQLKKDQLKREHEIQLQKVKYHLEDFQVNCVIKN